MFEERVGSVLNHLGEVEAVRHLTDFLERSDQCSVLTVHLAPVAVQGLPISVETSVARSHADQSGEVAAAEQRVLKSKNASLKGVNILVYQSEH